MANEERIVGATIAGKYRVRRIVGGGSMGVVCEAEHIDIGKRVAIKLIDASLAGMNEVSLRFRQEARAASLVESHHIVQVFDVGADADLGLYLVMEYLVGEDLAKVLAREKRLPIDMALRIAVQVARGLAKAHEAGVVHRDLKPANIFLCDTEDEPPLAKILDFGISKLTAPSNGSTPLKLTRDGMVVGTPQYMSPEQAQGYPVDERSDVWALGLVLYEMLAGRPAYPELPSYERFIIHLVSEPPDPLARVAPWVSAQLAGVVHAALEHDLSRRIQSCGELVKRLMEVHAADNSDTTVMTRPPGDPALTSASRLLLDRFVAAGPREPQAGARAHEDRLPVGVSSVTSSGVRGAAGEAGATVDDFEQDAPQFFDRKLIEPLHSPRPPPAGSAHAVSPTSEGARVNGETGRSPPNRTDGSDPSVLRQASGANGGARWRTRRVVGLGLAFVVVGLVVAATLVWR